MLDPRIAELIQADVDGELPASDRADLAAILERSEEARRFREDMLKVVHLLSVIPAAEPPAGLREAVLRRVRLPARRDWREWFAGWMRPASLGLAVAAGVLLAVGLVRFGPSVSAELDSLVGSMVRQHAGETELAGATAGSLDIGSEGVKGHIALKALDEQAFAMEFALDSAQPVEFLVDLNATGLRFGGFADNSAGVDVIEAADGQVRMRSSGRHDFVVFLRWAEGTGQSGEAIGIELSRQGERIFLGSLQPGTQDG